MAQADPTKTGDFSGFLKPEMASNYFDIARKRSTIMQLARQVPLGINGQEIPFSTAKASAAWVAEGEQKPTTESALGIKSFRPHKIAAISVVSAEVVRANPGNYMSILREDIAEAFAVAFDTAVIHGTNSPFGTGQNLAATTKSVTLGTAAPGSGSVYGDVVAVLDALVSDGKKCTGFAFDKSVEPDFLGSTDTVGRPLFIDTPLTDTASVITPGRIIGRPAYLGDNIKVANGTGAIVGVAGDWSQLVWGVTSGISYRVSTEAAVTIGGTLTGLWERNLVAILAEAEYGILLNDAESFCKVLQK